MISLTSLLESVGNARSYASSSQDSMKIIERVPGSRMRSKLSFMSAGSGPPWNNSLPRILPSGRSRIATS